MQADSGRSYGFSADGLNFRIDVLFGQLSLIFRLTEKKFSV